VDQRELVERAQRGDHDAFAVLAGVFVARLDAAARLMLRDAGAMPASLGISLGATSASCR
jgi:hypothetical protein